MVALYAVAIIFEDNKETTVMKALSKLLVTVVPLALVFGCATTDKTAGGDEDMAGAGAETEIVTPPPSVTEDTMGAEAIAAPGQDGGFMGDPLDDPDSLLSKRVIYFDFDRSEIKDEFRDIIEAHGQYLAENPGVRVVLEGHTDERGTREYNMGLGERRAKSVRRYMSVQGASFSQMDVVSYGEERPIAMGHDEDAWAENRRVEIVYPGR